MAIASVCTYTISGNTDGSKILERYQCPPSVSLALPPVGVQRTAEQLLHTTTLWEWLNTVVLRITIHSLTHTLQRLHVLTSVTLPAAAERGIFMHAWPIMQASFKCSHWFHRHNTTKHTASSDLEYCGEKSKMVYKD